MMKFVIQLDFQLFVKGAITKIEKKKKKKMKKYMHIIENHGFIVQSLILKKVKKMELKK